MREAATRPGRRSDGKERGSAKAVSNRTGRSTAQRDRYLELRRSGITRDDACREMNLAYLDATVRRYEMWFALEDVTDAGCDEKSQVMP